jgi:hypothetical protein
MYTRQMFKKAKAHIPLTACSAIAGTASSISSTTYGENFDLTLYVKTGPIHANAITTATTANCGDLLSGMTLDLKVKDKLSLVSTSTAANYWGIVWE